MPVFALENKMKRFLSVLIAAMIVAALCGCSNETEKETADISGAWDYYMHNVDLMGSDYDDVQAKLGDDLYHIEGEKHGIKDTSIEYTFGNYGCAYVDTVSGTAADLFGITEDTDVASLASAMESETIKAQIDGESGNVGAWEIDKDQLVSIEDDGYSYHVIVPDDDLENAVPKEGFTEYSKEITMDDIVDYYSLDYMACRTITPDQVIVITVY